MHSVVEPPDYQPISSYGAIGNLRALALVGLNGSIDWCCLPQFDSPSVFGGILDRRRGGRFAIAPATAWESRQRYWPDTNVLATVFQTAGGQLTVTDWMPLSGTIDGCGKSRGVPAIYRRLECEGSAVEVSLVWAPRPGFAACPPEIARVPGGFLARGNNGERICLSQTFPNAVLQEDKFGPLVSARFLIKPGDPLLLATHYDAPETRIDPAAALGTLGETAAVWRRWVDNESIQRVRQWAAADTALITRSELAMRLLAHGDSGGIAAAPTTSLPEVIGGERNWDYRFVWIRDSSQFVESFMALRHRAEVFDFFNFVERASARCQRHHSLKVMYGLHGELDFPEQTLEHLQGYRHSQPVRIGNRGFAQTQHDVYGEILNSAYELARLDPQFQPTSHALLAQVADQACQQWREPDHGLWEIGGEPRHYVYSKMMSWVALDRALLLAERFGLAGDVARWKRERDLVRADILRHGYSAELGAFVQAYGAQDIDAANLMMPMMEFLPFEDERIQGTINRTLQRLAENHLVFRYKVDDGLQGREGTFGLTTFWLVDALAFSNRLEEAHRFFESMIGCVNHLGLLSEQFDPATRAQLGNFPQAFSHLGLIDSSIHLAYVEHQQSGHSGDIPVKPPLGSKEHRAESGHA